MIYHLLFYSDRHNMRDSLKKFKKCRQSLYKAAFCAIFLLLFALAAASDLTIEAADLRIEEYPDGGYLLFIRQKEGVNSVMLTETTKDP